MNMSDIEINEESVSFINFTDNKATEKIGLLMAGKWRYFRFNLVKKPRETFDWVYFI